MYCRNCGFELKDSDKKCPGCGSPVVPISADATPQGRVRQWEQTERVEDPEPEPKASSGKTTYVYEESARQTYDASANTYTPSDDSGSFGWWCLGCCIPIVGLILFMVWKDTKPRNARMAGIGALVSVIFIIVMCALSVILGIGASFYYSDIIPELSKMGIDIDFII